MHHLGTHLDLTAPTLRKALRALVDHDLVVQHGGKGRPTTYHRTDTDRRNTSPAAVRRSAEIFCPIPPRLHVPPATILPVDDETGHAANQLTARGEEHHVPIAARPSFEEVAAVAAAFCQEHLTEEYADLSIKLAAKLARKRPSPLLRGDRRIWAAAVVCALGRLNFLADPSQTPHLPVARLATLFGVKQTTMSTKAKSVLDLLGLDHFDTEFCLPSRLISHPTAWLVLIDGLVHDARTLPVELQIALARRGVIPGVVVPADAEAPAGTEAGR